MKKIILLFVLAASSVVIHAQNCNAVFFNQDGTRFHVVLNGILQNINYETNVKVTDLKFEGSYKVTINFEEASQTSITKSIYMMDNNTEYSFEVMKNKKGVYVLRPSGMVAIAQAPSTPSQSVVVYSTTPPPPVATPITTNVNITETTTTTTVSGTTGNQENVSMGVNLDGVGMNVNVNINDGGMNTGTNVQTTTSQTVTTTVTSSSTNLGSYNDGMTTNPVHEAIPVAAPSGCYQAIPSSDFSAGKKSIENQSFADTKLKVAKTFTKNNCLSVAQIKEVIGLFSFEDGKLEYAKYAYDFCADKKNYYQVGDSFTFSGSVDELNEFLEGK